MRKVMIFPERTTAYMLKIKRLKRNPIRPLCLTSREYPMEKIDTAMTRSEMTMTKNPEIASPEKRNSKTDERGKEGKFTGRPNERKRPKDRKLSAPAAERI